MSKKVGVLLVVFIALFKTPFCLAQVNDAGLWTSVNVEKKLTSKFALTLTEEARMNENISELGTAFTEVGGTYKIKKYLSLGASYRFIQRRRVDDFYSFRHRYMVDVVLKKKVKKFAFTIRERFQSQYADVYSSENGKVPVYYLRNKLTVKYDFGKKYTPFVAAELFYQLSNPLGNEIDNMRYSAGFEYKFNKKVSADLFYLLNKEVNVNDPWTDYVVGLGVDYSF